MGTDCRLKFDTPQRKKILDYGQTYPNIICILEFFVYTTLDFVSLQSQIHIAIASMMDVILHAEITSVKLQHN